MSELDESRRYNFTQNIRDTQVVITCTDKFLVNDIEAEVFKVDDGKIKKFY